MSERATTARPGPVRLGLRLAEVVGMLSLATDLGMGQPMGWALRSCVLAVRFGESLGLGADDLRAVYYLALIRFIGCTADAHVATATLGDELAARTWMTPAWYARPVEMGAALLRNRGISAEGVTTLERAGLVHDVGRVGVSSGIWLRPGPLDEGEWERVRLHPYYTERIACPAPVR